MNVGQQAARKSNLRIHQIAYDDASQSNVLPPFLMLDNSAGPPDWFELWPILNFLRTTPLEEDVWYGFVSPKFCSKTHHSWDQVLSVIETNPQADVALFSFDWASLALSLNPWEFGERFQPGLIEATEAFLKHRGTPANLRTVICDFDTSVNSNYMVGRKRFWLAWQSIAEEYFAYVNGGPHLLDNKPVSHRSKDGYPLKAFVQERLVCWVFLSGQFSVVRPDYVRSVAIEPPVPQKKYDATIRVLLWICNQSKVAARRSGFTGYLVAFHGARRLARRLRRHGKPSAPLSAHPARRADNRAGLQFPVAEARSTETPGPMVDESETLRR